MTQKLVDGIKKLGIEVSQEQLDQLETYINCVLTFNETYNLMKADSADELAVNHVLDSLAAVKPLTDLLSKLNDSGISSPSIGDIGSGGGCPGIPLATVFPQYKFTLVERMEKRCVFLEDAVKKMGLKNVTVNCTQADTVAPESFNLIVFRAFHPFDKKILKTLFAMLPKGGYIAAYKARAEKIKEEMEAVKIMVPDYQKIALTVPFLEDHERNLVVIQK